jgi:hypothetical protein
VAAFADEVLVKRRWAIRLGIALVVLATAVLLLPLPRSILIGLLRGEAFYKGRPTNYWKDEIKYAIDARKPWPSTVTDRLLMAGGLVHHHGAVLPNLGEPAALPVLAELLSDPDVEVRWHAAAVLFDKGPWAEPALPRLKEMLQDDDPRVRRTCVFAVQSIETRTEVKIHLFAGILKDNDLHVRIVVAELLGRIGDESDEAIAALKEAINDEAAEVRMTATKSLKKLQP